MMTTTKPTSTLLRLFISIAITVGVVLVYAKSVPGNGQADGFLIQQQEQPNAGDDFVVAYGGGEGDIPNYNLDSPELNADPPPFGAATNPTPTIQENPTPAEGGESVAFN